MPLQMPGINPLIMQAMMQQKQGIGGPQLPQPAMRPSGSGLNGGGFSATGPAPQQPARPGVGGMLQNPMQMAMLGQMFKGMNAPPLPIGSASGAPLGSLQGSMGGGSQFVPGGMDLTGLSGGTAGGMDVGGGLGSGYTMGATGYSGMGGMDFGGGLSAPAWQAGGWSPAGWGSGAGLLGSGGDAAAFEGGAWLGGDAALGGAAAGIGGAGAAEGIGATIAANPELWALAFA